MTWLKEFIYCFYLNRFDPTLENTQHAIKTTLVTAIASAILLLHPDSQGLWLVLPAALLMLTYKGELRSTRLLCLLSASCALIAGVSIASVLGTHIVLFTLMGFVFSGIAFYLTQYGKNVTISAVLVLILIVIAGNKPITSLDLVWARVANVAVAAVIALIVSVTLWPYNPKKLIKKRLDIATRQLKHLSKWTLLDHICGNHMQHYITQIREQTFENLRITRSLLTAYPQTQKIKQWRLLLRFYGAMVAISQLLAEPSNGKSLNRISNDINRIQRVLEQCFENLHNPTQPLPAKSLHLIAMELEKDADDTEDLVSLAFLLKRTSVQIEEYHALIHSS
jgi:uncharacterized membrane protein YccC